MVLGAVMVPHAAKQGSFAQADDDADDDDEDEEEDNWEEQFLFFVATTSKSFKSPRKLLETLPGYRSSPHFQTHRT